MLILLYALGFCKRAWSKMVSCYINLKVKYTTLLALPLMLKIAWYLPYGLFDAELKPIETDIRVLLGTYDFIVVGSGSAGAVVANRLSENAEWKVLLLEAGGEEIFISDIPITAAYLQLTEMDWQYKPEPQDTACLAMEHRRCNWPRGKVIGGSSVLNYMLYVRGNKKDFDHWESLGNPGWGSEEVLEYFKKSEDNKNSMLSSTRYHSTGGYLTVSEAPYQTPLAYAFLEAAEQLQYKVRDVTGEYQAGFAIAQGTVRKGARCSAAKAFLRPIRHRRNLHISLNSQVTRILIHPENKTAFGVEFIHGGAPYRVKGVKEVVLSAGAINSPQLLMLSGVGPRHDLELLKIPVVQDLKVGSNLQDHIGLGGFTFMVNEKVSLTFHRLFKCIPFLRYILFGSGPLTVLGGVEGLGFVHTKYANASEDFPDVQYQFASGSVNSDGGTQLKHVYGLTDEFYKKTFSSINNKDVWSIMPILLRPKSRGIVKLRSQNPFDQPLIYANYFQDSFDMKTLVEGVKIAFNISQTPAFKRYGSELQTFPDCDNRFPLFTDIYWECMIRLFTITIYHHVGTCKMGPQSDPEAVVDSQLRVHGIKGLRVIDASIMPTIVSGNTHASTVMIGEKGSDLIKNFWSGNGYEDELRKHLMVNLTTP